MTPLTTRMAPLSSLISLSVSLSVAGCGVAFDYEGHSPKDSETGLDTPADTSSDDTSDYTDLPPTITSVTVTPNPVSSTESFTIDAVVIDDYGIDFVTSTILESSQQMSKIAPDRYNVTYTASDFSLGDIPYVIVAYDTLGQLATSIGTVSIVDRISPTVISVYAVPTSVFNDGTESFLVYACFSDETDGTALGGSVTATIDTVVETLSYDSGSTCFISSAVNGNKFSEGIYSIAITGFDTAGNSVSDNSASIEIIEPSSCPYTCASNVCLYVDGVEEATLSTAYPSHMTSIDTIRLGHGGQYFDNVLLVVDTVTFVDEDFSSSIGCFTTGSASGGMYITDSTDNNCVFSPAFDATSLEWMVSADVLSGSNSSNLALRDSSYPSAPGANWSFTGAYLDDGAGTGVSFTSGTPDTTVDHTIVMCNYNN